MKGSLSDSANHFPLKTTACNKNNENQSKSVNRELEFRKVQEETVFFHEETIQPAKEGKLLQCQP